MNYYQTLGLKPDATYDQIKEAYRQLMRKYHPDLSELPRDEATSKSAEVNEAYRVLTDGKKRADYDNLLRLRGEQIPTFRTDPKPADPQIGKDPGGKENPAPWASEDGVRKRTSETSFSDEEFLQLLKDRTEFKRMIDKYYSVHNSRIRLNWSNSDLKTALARPASAPDARVGIENEMLDLYDVEMSASNASDSIIEKMNARNCNLKGINLQGSIIYDCELTECDFTGANLTGVVIQNPRKIQKCIFVNAKLDNITFRGEITLIRNCNFKGATAKGMNFTDLSGKPKLALKEQILACLTEPHWRNINTEQIVVQIEAVKAGKKGFWPFGKK